MIIKGTEFHQTFLLSEHIYKGFLDLYGDKNILHTNEEYAIQKGFKGRVMHGNILNGFLSYFIGECLPMKNVIIHSQEINYKKPVYLNEKLEFYAIVNDYFESVKALELKFHFENKDKQKIAQGKISIGLI